MQGFKGSERGFRVRVRPEVLRYLGNIPVEVFERIQAALEDIATMAAIVSPPKAGVLAALGDSSLSLTVGAYVALYEVDTQGRTVTLLELTQRLSSAASGTGSGYGRRA